MTLTWMTTVRLSAVSSICAFLLICLPAMAQSQTKQVQRQANKLYKPYNKAKVGLLNAKPLKLNVPLPDLTTATGFYHTCNAMGRLPVLTKQTLEALTKTQLQAWVVCKDVALLQQTMSWFNKVLNDGKNGQPSTVNWNDAAAANRIFQTQLNYMQRELAAGREVLQYLSTQEFTPLDSLHLRPQEWHLDLDGNGEMSPWEQAFFALPNRTNYAEFKLGKSTEQVNPIHLQMDAFIKTDATDILWALSYHEFLEAAVELLRSQYIDIHAIRNGEFQQMFTLKQVSLWTKAYQHIQKGIEYSSAMRQSALSETDNDYEWIPNPKQTNSAFPIYLDSADYETWQLVLSELKSLWQGDTVLVINSQIQKLLYGIPGHNALVCDEGTGLDVPKFFTTAPPSGLLNLLPPEEACSFVNKRQTESNLSNMITNRIEEGSFGSYLLRYFYWIN
jgi:hypothetical protein